VSGVTVAAEQSRPCTVGLTGGLASGKSSVAGILAARGVPCLDADRVVHELYAPGGDGAAAVRELFGNQALAGDGGVDRQRLGRLVLANAEARAALEGAVHPLVRREVRRWLETLARAPVPPPVAVVEAALLVETGSARDYDVLMVVWCRPEQQLARAVARGVDESRAQAILDAQQPLDQKRALADVVIDNSGDPGALGAEVRRGWERVVERCAAARDAG